jgi:hypothetical protein
VIGVSELAGGKVSREDLKAIGAVTHAWAMLDSVLRALVLALPPAEVRDDWEACVRTRWTHGTVMDHLSKAAGQQEATIKTRLFDLLARVGEGRGDALNGRRNHLVHGIVWKRQDASVILRRIGFKAADVVVPDVDAFATPLLQEIGAEIMEGVALWKVIDPSAPAFIDFDSPP